MKGLLLFKGKYGATDQYANWIGSKLHIPAFEAGEITSVLLQDCDYLVIGSSVYMGKLILGDWLKKYSDILINRKLFLFIVCATPSKDSETQKRIIHENIPETILKNCSIFFLPGRLDLKTLNWRDKWLLKFACWFEKNPDKKKILLNGIDAVNEENIGNLLKAVETFTFSDKVF